MTRLPAATLTVVDDIGAHVTLASPAQRIVSLAPSATEMLFAAGAGSRVLATVAYSDEPAAARRVPRIGDSTAIDMEQLLRLRPDVVVYWPGGNNAGQVAQLRRLGVVLYGQRVEHLEELGASLRRLGTLTGTGAIADARAGTLEAQLAALRMRYARRSAIRVLLETWNQPLYTVGARQILSDALSLCGAVNVFGDLPQLSPAVQVEAVISRDPDLIVAAAPPGAAADWLQAWHRYPSLTAVRTGNLMAAEDPALSRLGPSLVGATARLCEQIDAARARR